MRVAIEQVGNAQRTRRLHAAIVRGGRHNAADRTLAGYGAFMARTATTDAVRFILQTTLTCSYCSQPSAENRQIHFRDAEPAPSA